MAYINPTLLRNIDNPYKLTTEQLYEANDRLLFSNTQSHKSYKCYQGTTNQYPRIDRYRDVVTFAHRLNNNGTIRVEDSFAKDVSRPTIGDYPVVLETTGKATIDSSNTADGDYTIRINTSEGKFNNTISSEDLVSVITNHLQKESQFHIPEVYVTLKLKEDKPTLDENATIMQLGHSPYE